MKALPTKLKICLGIILHYIAIVFIVIIYNFFFFNFVNETGVSGLLLFLAILRQSYIEKYVISQEIGQSLKATRSKLRK